MNERITEQEPPQPSRGDTWLKVIADMEERREHGIEKYGTPLQPFNGRDPLIDAYQEALDLCVYLRQAIEERADTTHKTDLCIYEVTKVVEDMREYIMHHGLLMGECVAWDKLKKLVGVGQS